MVLATCNGCLHGVVFELYLAHQISANKLLSLVGDISLHRIDVLNHWPKREINEISESVPENIALLMRQAGTCFENGAYDAAGVMYRKVLEVSTKEKAPEHQKKSLDRRIDELAKTGILPPDVKDWAHEIRLEGNFAAHDVTPFTRDQAELLEQFCNAYLMYVYTMPQLVSDNRSRRVEPLPLTPEQ
jgi:hypothetical protein